jgi:hypothetical protein
MSQHIHRPPGPQGVPIFGSLPALLRDPLGFFEHCASYGDIAMC